ncbi:CHAD domain-containing protein [Bosea sp. 685]|uniref:CHAD domain-containing protein n=1 Tax=Bosea sp. 685 TaxID=3080057 RepID=UPI0028934EC9|nr:CHAD domain-containing protein [Bosea sp. 685]WNJ88429.1 CHAD domain-containing protein [Bosea sp. 685]
MRRKPKKSLDAAEMMQRWARHWLRSCRDMPKRALRLIDDAQAEPEQQVHAFRRLMKAWRSLLKLAPDSLADEAGMVRTEIRALRRDFGAARDAVVLARTLEDALGKSLFERLPKPQREAGSPAVPSDLRQRLEAARIKLGRLSVEMARWSVAGEGGAFLLKGFERSCRKTRRRLHRDPLRMSLKRLHASRTAIVDLGYQLQFFRPAEAGEFALRGKLAERLRSQLGAVVDLDLAQRHLITLMRAGLRAKAEHRRAEHKKAGHKKAEHRIARRIVKRRGKAARLARRLLDERPKTLRIRLGEMMAIREPRRVKLS